MIGPSALSNPCDMEALATSVGGVLGAPICATPEVQQSVVEELNLQDALPSTTETLADSGDRDQYSALGGDREFFLDEFDTDSTFISGVEQPPSQDPSTRFYLTQILVPVQTRVQSQGE